MVLWYKVYVHRNIPASISAKFLELLYHGVHNFQVHLCHLDSPSFLHEPRSYPRNNDPVVCTELGMLSKLSEEFEERNCNLLAIGVDSKIGHRAFIKEVQVS